MLLRNEDGLLPLDPGELKSIAVIGPLADSKRDTLGPWVFDFDLDETVTVFEGIRDGWASGVQVEYAPGVAGSNVCIPSPFDRMDRHAADEPDGFDDDAEIGTRRRARTRRRRRNRRAR